MNKGKKKINLNLRGIKSLKIWEMKIKAIIIQ